MIPRPLPTQRGFTIIELMGVLAILSILAIVAIPTYQKYSVRAEVAEGINIIKPFRYAIYEYHTQFGNWPPNNNAAGMKAPEEYETRYVESITITKQSDGATITIKYKIPALGENDTLVYYTTLVNNQIRWHCDAGTMDNNFRPASCRME